MSDVNTYFEYLDYPDIGESVGFFAFKRRFDDETNYDWVYEYSLYLTSTGIYGGGEGGDFILESGDLTVYDPDEFDFHEFAEENAPVIPQKLMYEWDMDFTLCDLAEMYSGSDKTLRELLEDYEGGMFLDQYDELAAYATKNHWTFPID